MVLRKMICILLVLSISGCTAASSVRPGAIDQEKVRTFASIYRQAKEAREAEPVLDQAVKLLPDPGEEAAYFPVYEHARVARVWVPAHVALEDKGVLVAGHWTFVMVEEPHWYIQDHGMDKIAVPVIVPSVPREE